MIYIPVANFGTHPLEHKLGLEDMKRTHVSFTTAFGDPAARVSQEY